MNPPGALRRRAGARELAGWRLITLFAQALLVSQACAADYRPPRTVFGAPDLQGTWTNQSRTSLERPRGADSLVVSAPEAAALESEIVRRARSDDAVGQADSEWLETVHLARIDGRYRTSWIVSPTDGRLPYSAEGRRRLTARQAADSASFDGPEDRTGLERCLLGGAGPPIVNLPAAANFQIVQTAGEVAILSEVNHDLRIVRLNGPHAPQSVRPWMGDSIGHWERDTLVVETTNFQPSGYFRLGFLMSANATVTERFTRVSQGEIRYEFSVADPTTFTETWRGEMPFLASNARIYEYACHEGNYALSGILAGARRQEGAAAGRDGDQATRPLDFAAPPH